MSHLLSSVNKEAAEAIRPIPPRDRLPDVGEIVIYHMRTGHGRQGRTRFPALVQSQGERGTLGLTVILEAGELLNATLVEETGPGKDGGHCWERPDGSHLADAFRNTVTALATRVGDLEQQVADLRKVVLGDFDVPRISIIDIMQDFENRLRDIASQAGAAVARDSGRAPRGKKGK